MALKGKWHNELGSVMVIGPVVDGGFELTYKTAVSTKNCAKGSFKGSGRLNTSRYGQTVAFTVSWQNKRSNCRSVTAWSGQLQKVDGEEQIVALWLLTGIDPKNKWASTNIGQDVFTKTQPKKKAIAKNLRGRRHSHP